MRNVMHPFCFCVVAAIIVAIQARGDPCSVKCAFTDAKQTLCQYGSGNYGQKCNQILRKGLTPEEKKMLLAKHNKLRRNVANGKEKRGAPGPQPAAKNMKKLVWDDEIAEVAQAWADQCDFNHDQCRDIPGVAIGQNIAFSSSSVQTKVDIREFVDDWYNEVEHFNNADVKKFTGVGHKQNIITHYTQIVWAKTDRLGCGLVEYHSSDGWFTTHIVCNYGPRGNMLGDSVYLSKCKRVNALLYKSKNNILHPCWFESTKQLRKFHLSIKTTYLISLLIMRNTLHSFCFCIFAAIIVVIQARDDSCSVKCYGSEVKQTLCQYGSGNYGQKCNNKVIRKGLTDEEKKILVDKHNEYRKHVASGKETKGSPGPQPAAKNMQDLEWDDEIAEVAQAWADQCDFSHDQCRDIPRFQVGQNIASSSASEEKKGDVSKLVDMWYNEVNNFNKDEVKKFSGANFMKIGHYTQLVWAKTNRLGCGLIEYHTADNWYNTFLVCNYGPTGNMFGDAIYET
ncbi:uncharacterized protein [Prorops nasuta]|uniref:uncharacterized protein n=1 Tax=Prorops nasuta TaxID=863751 RepID=UPI0034CF844A